MKIKYAIYKTNLGYRASMYVDKILDLKGFPYVDKNQLPIIINDVGGYTSFDLEYEKEHGFVEIIEIEENERPLTRQQMYPKNSPNFELGWISPNGDTYSAEYEEHLRSAEEICEELGYGSYRGERKLEEKGWVKVTGSWDRGKFRKVIFAEDLLITKKQAETLHDLGLWKTEHVPGMIRNSKNSW